MKHQKAAQRVVDFANRLEVSEHDVFDRAYRHYYGVDHACIKDDFRAYLRDETVPIYVTGYLRANEPYQKVF